MHFMIPVVMMTLGVTMIILCMLQVLRGFRSPEYMIIICWTITALMWMGKAYQLANGGQ
jgi:hypothetical protein